MEVTTRFELVDEGFADPCLTTWPRHHIWSEYFHSIWSGRRGSNSLPPPWQGGALPDELRPHIPCVVPGCFPATSIIIPHRAEVVNHFFPIFSKKFSFRPKTACLRQFSPPGGGFCPVHVCGGICEENLIAFSFTNHYNKVVILSL